MCCIGLPLVLVLEQIRIYGERAAILEDLGWIDAFKRGWQVLVENIGATLILWLIFFVLGIVIFVISAGIAVALFVPLMGMFVTTDPSWWWVAPLCVGGLLGTIIYAVVRAIIVAFTSATWTLAYRDLTGNGDHPQLDNLELIG
jgi:cell division protein FtsW (lipid II flippase)